MTAEGWVLDLSIHEDPETLFDELLVELKFLVLLFNFGNDFV